MNCVTVASRMSACMTRPRRSIEHAVAERRSDTRHFFDVELVEDRVHDREAAGQHGCARGLEARDAVGIGAAGVEQEVPEPVEAVARDAVRGPRVLEEDALDAARRARGTDRLPPARALVALRDDRELLASLEYRALEALLVDRPSGKVPRLELTQPM
jgi:hypothetical protein